MSPWRPPLPNKGRERDPHPFSPTARAGAGGSPPDVGQSEDRGDDERLLSPFPSRQKESMLTPELAYPHDWVPALATLLRQENDVLGPTYRHDVGDASVAPSANAQKYATLTPEQRLSRVPTERDLRTLIDTSFFASLEREEGRQVAFRLAYFPRSLAERIAYDSFVFATPLPFDPQQLVKLAPAVDHRASYIAVEPGDNDALQIWGIVHYGSQAPPDVRGHGMPTCPNVVVWRPGVLTLRYASMSFSFRYTPGLGMLPPIGSASGDIDRLASSLLSFRTIQGLGSAMLEKSHGGAVFALPAAASTPDHVKFRRYGAALPCGILKTPSAATNVGPVAGTDAELHDAYRFVASLTAVDGAVLLDSDLNVRGFGAFVDSLRAEVALFDLQGNSHSIRHRGARHASAASFCGSCDTAALALVVSQDGGTQLFVKEEGGRITVVPNIHAYWHPF